ncbi:hypothetical protein O3M35_003133 [Rhynocoris fuscipes]|uniref:Ion transport domain-containing protein n=1 Tax=Rhynocoris fuscipes TaxID=488301 RepID=A0AAW1CHY4_9HEMI
MYSLVPNIEMDDMSSIERRFSEAPSTISVSSKDSIVHIMPRRRHDRRKERLNTELLTAVQNSSYSDVIRLLDTGASPDATCRPSRVSAIHIAALQGDSATLRELIRFGARCSVRDRSGRQAVHYAAWAGQAETLLVLLRADPSLVNSPVKPNPEPDHEMECLDSWNHDHDLLNHLVPDGVDLLSTPLHLACKTICYKTVELLLSHGADVTIKDAKGLTPLDVTGLYAPTNDSKPNQTNKPEGKVLSRAAPNRHGHFRASAPGFKMAVLASDSVRDKQQEIDKTDDKPAHRIVTALIKNGAKMPKGNVILKEGSVINQNKMPVTTLHTAVVNEELELIECLLQNGACLTTWNDNGETPIHLAVKKWLIEPLKKMISWDMQQTDTGYSSIVDVRDSLGRTPLHLAVMQEWPTGVALLLESGADVATTSNDNESVLHLAAERGNKPMLEELLSIPDSRKVLEYRNSYYHTPLFRAVESKHLPCVELLCENGADATTATPGDVTLLHIASLQNSPDILGYLLSREAIKVKDVLCKEIKGGVTALHIAAKEGYTECVQELLQVNCNVFVMSRANSDRGGTALHLAAEKGHLEVVKIIIRHNIKTVESLNADGWQPLHIAAGFGRSECVKHIVNSGADLSASVWDDTGRKTALDIIMYCVPQPVDFLEELFDSYMKGNEHPLNDPACEIKLQYDVLSPGDRCCKQLKVLNAILNNGNQHLQQRLLLHPLTESFVHIKWKQLKIFFSLIVMLHVILTLSLTILAHLAYVDKGPSTFIFVCSEVARVGLFASLIPIILVEFINVAQLQRYYAIECESWVKWGVIITASIVGIVDPSLPWPRHIASIAVLLSWIELLFLLARFPNWGFYVLMFSKVASNVLKVLASFTFLVLGFTFAFLIHFEAAQPFRNLIEALIKVFVMMLEFDYENMFEQFKELNAFSVIGRLIFITFVILVAMVMMNLMIGLAVSDIALLEKQGRTQRLAKQTSFLSLLESTVYNARLLKILPKRFHEKLQKLRAVPEYIVIKPTSPIDSSTNDIPKCLKESILNRIWSSQTNNEDLELTVSLHDINYKIDKLADIVHDKLTDATSSSSSSSSRAKKSKCSTSSKTTLVDSKNTNTLLEEIIREQKLIKEKLEKLEENVNFTRTVHMFQDQPQILTQPPNYI